MLARPDARIDHRFVIAAANASMTTLRELGSEQSANRDLLLLRATSEQMAGGKNLDYYLSVAEAAPHTYEWVVKADDDTYIAIPRLIEVLGGIQATDAFWGQHWPWPVKALRSTVALLRPNSTGPSMASQMAAARAASSALVGFDRSDFGEARPSWFFCGPLYAISADLVRWLRCLRGSELSLWVDPRSLPARRFYTAEVCHHGSTRKRQPEESN